ncbi:MAG: hypothetical protein ACYCST_04345 [Acidimicrobiales bacterium]
MARSHTPARVARATAIRAFVVAIFLLAGLFAIEKYLGGLRTTNFVVGHNLSVPRSTIDNALVDAAWAGWALLAVLYLYGLIFGIVRYAMIRSGHSRVMAATVGPDLSTQSLFGQSSSDQTSSDQTPPPSRRSRYYADATGEDDIVDAEIVVDQSRRLSRYIYRVESGESVFEAARELLGDPGLWPELVAASPALILPEDWVAGTPLNAPESLQAIGQHQLAAIPETTGMARVKARIEQAFVETPALLAHGATSALGTGTTSAPSTWPEIGPIPPVLPLDWMLADVGAAEWAALIARAMSVDGIDQSLIGMRVSRLGTEVMLDADLAVPPGFPAQAWPYSGFWGVTRDLATLEILQPFSDHALSDLVLLAVGHDEVGVVFIAATRQVEWLWQDEDPPACLAGLVSSLEFSPLAGECYFVTAGFAPAGMHTGHPGDFTSAESADLTISTRPRLRDEPVGNGPVVVVGKGPSAPLSIPGLPWRPLVSRVQLRSDAAPQNDEPPRRRRRFARAGAQ